MSYKVRYKLTSQGLTTYCGFHWKPGNWVETSGDGSLCGSGWLHCYSSPLVAVLHNPMHADIWSPRLWKAEVAGMSESDLGLKEGWTRMRLKSEIEIPKVSKSQRVAYAIYCVQATGFSDPTWAEWANAFLSGKNRTIASAASVASVAEINLPKLARQALKVQ